MMIHQIIIFEIYFYEHIRKIPKIWEKNEDVDDEYDEQEK